MLSAHTLYLRNKNDELCGCSAQQKKCGCHGVVDRDLFLKDKTQDNSQDAQHHHIVDAHADVLGVIQGWYCDLIIKLGSTHRFFLNCSYHYE